ncbi:MAG: chromate transporter [Clostridia bacterium]|nr:chromate transporter [Clostridia bacterium]
MIYLKLFLTFLEIGAFSFGGGYGMISLIREAVTSNGWLTESEFMNFVAVSESTPGPLAVNMATFVGASRAGIFGALLATLGVVLPSFIIILIIAALISNLLKYSGVKAFLSGVRPCIVALILATAVTLGANTLFSFKTLSGGFSPDFRALFILAVLILIGAVFKHFKKKTPSPILMIVLSAFLGIAVYKFI